MLLAGCSLPGGAGAKPAASPARDVITPSKAESAVRDQWDKGNVAGQSGDVEAFKGVEDGAVLKVDRAYYAHVHDPTFHKISAPAPLGAVKVFVPHQAKYPARFAALIDSKRFDASNVLTDKPITYLFVYEAASEGAPWLVVFNAEVPHPDALDLAVNGDGFAPGWDPQHDASLTLPTDQVAATFVDFVTASPKTPVKTELDGAPDFNSLAATPGFVKAYAGPTSSGTVALQPDPVFNPLVLATGHGGALTMFVNTYSYQLTPKSPTGCYNQAVRNGHLPLGYALPVGSYLSITHTGEQFVVVLDPAKTTASPQLDVAGEIDSTTSSTGTPLPPGRRCG